MKKITSIISIPFIISATLLLFSCTAECEHEYLTSTVVAPTCGEEGYTLNTCTECSSEFKTNYKLPTGHTLNETLFAPTCEKEGYTYYACACGYSYKSGAVPPSGHSYVDTVVEVSCEAAGYVEHTCTVCGHTYKSDFVSSEGHIIMKKITPPTKDTVGYTEYTCEICGDSYRSDYVFYSDVHGGGSLDSATVVTKGIDVSKWQNTPIIGDSYEPLDWQAIKASGIDYAILRAGNTGYETGTIHKDPVFEINYRDAKAAGVMVGAYYYSVATTEEKLDEEIDALLGWLDGKKFEYPIYLDVEDKRLLQHDKEALTRLCMKFVTRMREEGYLGAIYSNQDWLDNFMYRDVLEGFCDIWFANYVSSDDKPIDGIYPWDEETFGAPLAMWQYTDKGIIKGSNMHATATVDMNYCYKDYPTIIKTYGLNGFSLETSTQ